MTQHWTRHLPKLDGPLERIATEIEKKKHDIECGIASLNMPKYIEYLESGADACARTHWPAEQIEKAKATAALEIKVIDPVLVTT